MPNKTTSSSNKVPDKDKMVLTHRDIRNNTLSIRKAAAIYGISRTTIQDRLHGRISEGVSRFGPESYLSAGEDKKITEWIINLSKCGFPLKRDDLLNTVQKIFSDSKRKTSSKIADLEKL